jgi:hypothetical protein
MRLPAGVAVALLAIVAAACDPIPHTEYTARAGPTSPITFELLSGDARYAVVRSTGPSGGIPSAGRFRVERAAGTVVALPSAGSAVEISRDGSRVLLNNGGPQTLWASGLVLTPPAGARFADDLRFAVFRATDGRIKTWETATQTIREVETAFTRPPGTTAAVPKDISDNGQVVQYELQGTTHVERFVNLGSGQKLDVANQTSSDGAQFVTDDFVLASGGGGGFQHVHQAGSFDPESGEQIDESWGELVALPSGAPVRRYTNTTGESITRSFVNANANLAWMYQARTVRDGETGCPDLPAPAVCTVASHIGALSRNVERVFDTGSGALLGVDTPANGRLLLVTKNNLPWDGFGVGGPVRVLDWINGNVETLDDGETYTDADVQTCAAFGHPSAPCTLTARSARGNVSDDGRTIATTTHTNEGWYEYLAPPPE